MTTAYLPCGHPYTSANTFTAPAGGTTRCRACQNLRRRRAAARSRARRKEAARAPDEAASARPEKDDRR